MNYLRSFSERNLSMQTALVRIDLNIDPDVAAKSLRLTGVLPTITFLIERGARVVLLSHRGRPTGFDEALSLEPFAPILSRKLRGPIRFAPTLDFAAIRRGVDDLLPGDILLLENLRFFEGEEKNDAVFARQLASLGTLYVNDAFAVSHRANASVEAITRYLPSYVGILLEKEISNLTHVLQKPKKPLILISGGAKVSTKIDLLNTFLKKADTFLIGGAMANTFMKASGKDIGFSMHEKTAIPYAKKLLKTGKITLPVDTAGKDGQILDIGPKTRRLFSGLIKGAKTIIWNGPMGHIEDKDFAAGTRAIIRAVAQSKGFSVVGGGETLTLIEHMKASKKISFTSTGGGAMLEFLAGKKLPGIEALKHATRKLK